MTASLLPLAGLDDRGRAAWAALCDDALEHNVFLEPAFLEPAARHLPGGDAARLLVVTDGEEWLAAVPVLARPKFADLWLPCLRSWRHPYTFSGTPLLRAGAAERAAAGLVAAIDGVASRAFLALEHVTDGPVAAALMAAGAARPAAAFVHDRAERAAVLRGPQDDALARAMNGKRRRELARTRRSLGAELGGEPALVETTDDPGALDQFLALEAAGWKGEAGSALASDPAHERFQRESAAAFAALGRLHLLELHAGDRTAASVLALRTPGPDATLSTLKIGHDETLRRGTPGVHLMGDIASWAHARGDVALVDSCAVPDNPMINRLWPDRIGLSTLILPAAGARGELTRRLASRSVRAARTADAVAAGAAGDGTTGAASTGARGTRGIAASGPSTPGDATVLRARALEGPDAPAAFEAAWRAVEAARPDLPVSRTWTWTAAWLRHYGPRLRHELVVVEDGTGAPRGATLLVRHERRYGPATVRWCHVGTGGEPQGEELCPEANGPAATPGDDAAVMTAVCDLALRRRWWHELRVERIAEEDAPAFVDRWPADALTVVDRTAYQYDLAGLTPEQDIPGGLRGGPRRRVRTTLRAMAARGPLTLDWAETAEDAGDVLEELIDLHQDAWQAVGKPGVFSSASFVGFHREVAPLLVAAGRATMVRVRCGEETIGALYGFRDGDRLRAYQSGFRRFDDNRLRPGIVAHVLAMEAARTRGVALYDHLAGDARYKRELSTREEPSRTYGYRRARLRLKAYDKARELRDRRAAEAAA
ncbi:GNAT family N-acetyltransferase [Patulibacter americanus]|uniref:GNAT family N-acetyltransferase n=1 Tax=Patulibacter americanus TaxID=588672 RepID=UPI0003B52444|nr:GNAT family N-acetyltransferase [Patulibacter americanus]